MIRALRSWLGRSAAPEPTPAERFQQAFAAELARVETERRRHAQVRRAEAELQARVHDVLRSGGGA